jgi:hypothetical protein
VLLARVAAVEGAHADAGGLFSGAAVGVADDIDGGKFDRLLSLPVPRSAILLGRSLADTVLVAWATFITVAIGFATGFRLHGGVPSGVAALTCDRWRTAIGAVAC